jgi:hypothetical protein
MGDIQKTDKSNAKNVDAINYKMGPIYWIGQLELNEYYIIMLFGKTKYRPFKVTVIKLVDALQVEPDDILSLILLVVRELAVSKEISNRRLSGFRALALGVDILRMALSIARSWIYVL